MIKIGKAFHFPERPIVSLIMSHHISQSFIPPLDQLKPEMMGIWKSREQTSNVQNKIAMI
jgi:hypothetical protein